MKTFFLICTILTRFYPNITTCFYFFPFIQPTEVCVCVSFFLGNLMLFIKSAWPLDNCSISEWEYSVLKRRSICQCHTLSNLCTVRSPQKACHDPRDRKTELHGFRGKIENAGRDRSVSVILSVVLAQILSCKPF